MKPEEVIQWFHEELLPQAVQCGRFVQNGEKPKIQACEFEALEKGISSFASEPGFAKLLLESNNETITKNLLVKFQSQDPIYRERMRLASQFKNEVTMYNTVIPTFIEFLKNSEYNGDFIKELVPECYFAQHKNEDIERSIVILEDLRGDGYRLSDQVTVLDLNHCLVCLKKLAQFHAVSFAMKLKNWKPFEKLKDSFVHVWMADDKITKEMTEDFKGTASQRGIDYLLADKNKQVPEDYLNNFRKRLYPLFDLLRHLHSPVEPLSVICHGDFNRNNILFKYKDGDVVDARMIDFQTFVYGSPCLDLSFFIYMNTTLEFREKYFDKVFNYYYCNLIKTVSDIVSIPEGDVEKEFPVEGFRDEFARVAIQAYPTVSFFLPVMMAPNYSDLEEDLRTKSFKEMGMENYNQGGEVVSRRIADVIVDFYRRKFYV